MAILNRVPRSIIAVIVLISFTVIPASAGIYGLVERGYEEKIKRAIFLVADTQFEQGLKIIEEYIEKFPDNPGGYFFYAAGVQEKIQKFNDFAELKRFYKYANKCQRLANKKLNENPDDTVSRLFLGAMDGYIGLLEAKQNHLIRAFKNAIESKNRLERVLKENPNIPDTYFGLGMLYYFSSKKAGEHGGILRWLIQKFITHGKDMRKEAVAMIEKSVEEGTMSSDYAVSTIMWIKLYNHEYKKARDMATKISRLFENDIMSRWVLGRVALKQGHCGEALDYFREIKGLNMKMNLPMSRFEDLVYAMKKAKVCDNMQLPDYKAAKKQNDQIMRWLTGKPKVYIEYQDRDNLIKEWKAESKKAEQEINKKLKKPTIF